jgi:hypothetical protein
MKDECRGTKKIGVIFLYVRYVEEGDDELDSIIHVKNTETFISFSHSILPMIFFSKSFLHFYKLWPRDFLN